MHMTAKNMVAYSVVFFGWHKYNSTLPPTSVSIFYTKIYSDPPTLTRVSERIGLSRSILLLLCKLMLIISSDSDVTRTQKRSIHLLILPVRFVPGPTCIPYQDKPGKYYMYPLFISPLQYNILHGTFCDFCE